MSVAIELRRHSERHHDDWGHLTTAGVVVARSVGESMRAFGLVASSPEVRATETAIAMGYGIDRDIPELARVGAAAMGGDQLADGLRHYRRANGAGQWDVGEGIGTGRIAT